MAFLMFVGIAAGALFLGLFGGVTCGLLRVTRSRGLVRTYAVFMVVLAVGLVVPFWVLVGEPPRLDVFTIFLILGGGIGGFLLTRVNIAEGKRVAQEENAALLQL